MFCWWFCKSRGRRRFIQERASKLLGYHNGRSRCYFQMQRYDFFVGLSLKLSPTVSWSPMYFDSNFDSNGLGCGLTIGDMNLRVEHEEMLGDVKPHIVPYDRVVTFGLERRRSTKSNTNKRRAVASPHSFTIQPKSTCITTRLLTAFTST